ncbi:hypothetical protein DP113_26415 [Brasilonema octagenarum UFV-E1]|uniref:Uncharacterized protein n=1 Tax=Brasilonema sennae CENA114 TaxID=415709 RepID=A0A856MLJ8_9CYAN|nr:effector-associated domain EAD1-containing protein [Brasilonema sennae]QDL10984.1 hypothetical protein DP114_26490 [Brasilonema sennae CENA114]QDL17330.1 hypothetical protein DP113_26415 [Brasilonema octagenarum UFV-E1]
MTINLKKSSQKELIEAILNAYPDEGDLKMLLDLELDMNLEEIKEGKNYKQIVYNLINKAEREGFLKQFIEAAHSEKPENQKLKAIKEKLFSSIFDHIDDSLYRSQISNEQWNNLCLILSEIKLSLLGRVCRITLENFTKTQDVLGNYPELADLESLGVLKTILLNKCPRNDKGIPSIVEFAERLSKEKEVGESHQNKLNQWVGKIAQELNLTLPTYFEDQSSATLQSYLLITVSPSPKSAKKFYLEAELIRDYLPNDAKGKLIKIDLNQESVKLECSFEEIAENIHQFISIAKTEHLKQYKHYLTVEIFLPLQLLGKSLDLEEISIGFNRRKPIGNEYKFLVRSLDRFISNYGEYSNRLSLRWEQLTKWVKTRLSQTDLQNKIYHISQVDDCNWDEIQAELEIKEKLGVKMTCCFPESDLDKEELFIAVLRGGVPIALWTRTAHIPNIEKEFDELLNIECFQGDFSDLIESVWKLRKKAHARRDKENYLGYHLGFLCDNPNRVPFHLQNQSLIETGM